MWRNSGFWAVYFVILLIKDVGAKICAQYRGYNDIVIYMHCYAECCGDYGYRYCCASGTVNLYAICAGVTLFGLMLVLIFAVCCRYCRRTRQSGGGNRTNRNDITTITQPTMFSGPPAYSPHDNYQGLANTAFHADVVTEYDYMKPPEYQKDPPAYEKDPPAYTSTTSTTPDSGAVSGIGVHVDTSNTLLRTSEGANNAGFDVQTDSYTVRSHDNGAYNVTPDEIGTQNNSHSVSVTDVGASNVSHNANSDDKNT